MYEQDFHDTLDALFASIEQTHADATQNVHHQAIGDTFPSPQPHIIDVYIVDHTAGEPPIIDSTLDTPIEQETQQQESHQDAQDEPMTPLSPSPLAPHAPHPRRWMLVGVVLVLILIGAVATSLSVVLMQTPSATVTLVTQAHMLTTTTTLHVVPEGHTTLLTNQLAGRILPALTMSEQQRVPTTGIVHQVAQAAHGIVTFYNAAPYAQTITAGTLLTGTDGVSVVTGQDAFIPAAVMPTEGQVTVAAHAALLGPQGNIGAGTIYGACCRLDVFVANGAFYGGQDARTYQTVAPQDVQHVVTSLTPSLQQSVQAALQTQIHASETLLTPLACTQQMTSTPSVGMAATTVSVTVNETCPGMTYATQDFTTLATQHATQDAVKHLGTGYTTTGIQTSITQVTPDAHGVLALHLTSHSLWSVQMSETQQQAIKTMLAGQSKDEATMLLLHLAGVQSVSLTLTRGTTLPKDTTHIALLILEPQE